MRRAALVFTISWLSACGVDDSAAPPAESLGEVQLTIGKGLESFAPLAEGGAMEVYLGPQGGHMVYVGYRVRGLDPGDASDPNAPGNPVTTVRARVGDTVVAVVKRRVGFPEVAEGEYEVVGTILVFKGSVAPETYLDTDVRLEVSVRDGAGRVAEATITVSTWFAGEDDVDPTAAE